MGAKTGEARRSRKWLQVLVNDRPELLTDMLKDVISLPADMGITWLSPLKSEDYCEYKDQEFVGKLGIELSRRSLAAFWPPRGAVWDGLGTTENGAVLLVEAKAHIAEAVSSPSKAKAPDSIALIRKSLEEAKKFVGAKSEIDWATCLYQYCNRLAHLYLLRELNGLSAYLVFIYFANAPDVPVPATREEWQGAIRLIHDLLGLHGKWISDYVKDVIVDTAKLVQ